MQILLDTERLAKLDAFARMHDLFMARYVGIQSQAQWYDQEGELSLGVRVTYGQDSFRIERVWHDNGITETVIWRDQAGSPVEPYQIVYPVELVGLPGDLVNLLPA